MTRAFLAALGWDSARSEPLAGDASTRAYHRLYRGTDTAILMQDPDGDVALFARIATHLCALGLSAPRILGQAPGLLLIEDLGDGLIARLATDESRETSLYLAATDALIALHAHPAPGDLPVATPNHLAGIIDLAFTHYADAPHAIADAVAALTPALQRHGAPQNVMILRDYHAENILWLPDRDGPARAGLLDFQDALNGHRAYDLISLIQDARRDVRATATDACISHYITTTGVEADDFHTSLAVLGAQRNLRILGVFARLATARNKPHYIDLIPRVWAHLQTDLRHPVLAPLRAIVDHYLPAPTAAHLERLRPCPTP